MVTQYYPIGGEDDDEGGGGWGSSDDDWSSDGGSKSTTSSSWSMHLMFLAKYTLHNELQACQAGKRSMSTYWSWLRCYIVHIALDLENDRGNTWSPHCDIKQRHSVYPRH